MSKLWQCPINVTGHLIVVADTPEIAAEIMKEIANVIYDVLTPADEKAHPQLLDGTISMHMTVEQEVVRDGSKVQ